MIELNLSALLAQATRIALREGGSYDPEWVSIAGWAVQRTLEKWTPEKPSMQSYMRAVIRNEIVREKQRKQRVQCLPPEALYAIRWVPLRSVHKAIAELGPLAPFAHAYFTEQVSLRVLCKRYDLSKMNVRKILEAIALTLCTELDL